MRKTVKMLMFTIIAFFISQAPAFAREMTISEFEEEVSKLKPDASYVYIIGSYAFTSEHKLTTQDVMLASKTIATKKEDGKTNKDPIYKKMTINKIERQYNKKFKPTGWKVVDNVLGTTKLEDNLNITHIDYNYYAEKSKATLSVEKAKDESYKQALKDLKFDGGNDSNSQNLKLSDDNKLTGLLLLKEDMDASIFSKEEQTGYYFAFVVEVPGANANTTISIVGPKTTTEATYDNFDVKDENPGMLVLHCVDPATLDNSKKVKVIVDLDGADNDEYEPTEYEIDYSGLTYQTYSKAEITDNTDDISSEDKTTLTSWGYTLFGDNKHYSLVPDDTDNAYKLTGKVEKQYLNENTFNEAAEEGYFFVFNIKKPEELAAVPEKVLVTVTGEKTFTYGKEAFNDKGVFTEIFKLKDNCSDDNCKIKIKVDWDGTEGKEYLESQEVTIN